MESFRKPLWFRSLGFVCSGAAAVVYVFSTTDRESYEALENWKRKVAEECGDFVCSVIVQNKIDLLAQSNILVSEVEDLARRFEMKLYRTCVKDGTMVNEGV